MSNPEAAANPKPDAKTSPKKPEEAFYGDGIPLDEVRFNRPNGVDLPSGLGNGINMIRSGANQGKTTYQIWLHPRIRAIRVVAKPASDAKPTRTFFIPESWVIYEAAE